MTIIAISAIAAVLGVSMTSVFASLVASLVGVSVFNAVWASIFGYVGIGFIAQFPIAVWASLLF